MQQAKQPLEAWAPRADVHVPGMRVAKRQRTEEDPLAASVHALDEQIRQASARIAQSQRALADLRLPEEARTVMRRRHRNTLLEAYRRAGINRSKTLKDTQRWVQEQDYTRKVDGYADCGGSA